MVSLKIGRNKSNEIVFDNDTVSGTHLQIDIIDYGNYQITDLQSTNGTFVNGKKVFKSNLLPTDKMMLGEYEVDMSALTKSIDAYYIENKIDFTNEYQELLKVFGTYQKKKNTIIKPPILPIVIRVGLGLVIILVLLLFPGLIPAEARIPLMMAVGLISVMSNLGNSQIKKSEKLDLLRLEYEDELVCPKCKSKMINQNITYWKGKTSCINPKCNAIYQK
jgi:pSer/pThr/pTyr-binding forkhead associated (FHA) protein